MTIQQELHKLRMVRHGGMKQLQKQFVRRHVIKHLKRSLNIMQCVKYSAGTNVLLFQYNHTSDENMRICQCLGNYGQALLFRQCNELIIGNSKQMLSCLLRSMISFRMTSTSDWKNSAYCQIRLINALTGRFFQTTFKSFIRIKMSMAKN